MLAVERGEMLIVMSMMLTCIALRVFYLFIVICFSDTMMIALQSSLV